MNVKQVLGMAGGFLFVYIVITLTNKPQIPTDTGQQSLERRPAGADTVVTTDLAAEPATAGAPAFGFCLPGLGAETLASAETDALLGKLSANAQWVSISPVLFQENGWASDVAEDASQSPSQAALAHAIAECHMRGLKVVLRPVVVAKDGTRRERFVPSDPDAWFKSYALAISPYVDLAAKSGVEVFCLGANYAQIEASQPWSKLSAQVRERFSGQLTYGAGTQSESGNGGYQAVTFWGDLDFVGVEAPAPADVAPGAAEETHDEAWQKVGEEIGAWVAARQPERKVFFTSVGYAPNATPSDLGSGYRAFVRTMGGQPWVAAANWYQWDAAIAQAPAAAEARPQDGAIDERMTRQERAGAGMGTGDGDRVAPDTE